MGEHGRVLQLLGPSTGGIRRVVATLTAGLRDEGWDVVTAGPPGVLDDLDLMVPIPDGLSPSGLRRARRAIDAVTAGVDVVHAHGLKPGWLAGSLRRRPPLVVSVHNLVLDEVAGWSAPALRAMEGALPRVADRIIALSDEVAARFAGAPVRTIPPSSAPLAPRRSAAEVRAAYGVAPDEPLLVCAARLHPQKDLPMLLEAVDRVRGEVEGARLLLLGDGPEEVALRRRAGSHVVFAGRRDHIADELAAADAVVISSRWESGPLVLFEAMQLGRPVVTTAVGAAPELVRDGVNGRIVPVGDAGAFAAAVVDVLRHPAGLGEAARATVADRRAEMVRDTAAVYREVLA